MTQPLLIGDVAARLGCSRAYVRALEDALKPFRTPNGTRIYDPKIVDAVLRSLGKGRR